MLNKGKKSSLALCLGLTVAICAGGFIPRANAQEQVQPSRAVEQQLQGARNPDVSVPTLPADKKDITPAQEENQRQFNYTGEAVPNSDPILYVGDYDMYTTDGVVRFHLSTEMEDKIRVVGPFSPETMNHYYLSERASYGDACRQALLPNHYSFADISVESLPVKPEIAAKASYIKKFGKHYVAVVVTDKARGQYGEAIAKAKELLPEIIASIKLD